MPEKEIACLQVRRLNIVIRIGRAYLLPKDKGEVGQLWRTRLALPLHSGRGKTQRTQGVPFNGVGVAVANTVTPPQQDSLLGENKEKLMETIGWLTAKVKTELRQILK